MSEEPERNEVLQIHPARFIHVLALNTHLWLGDCGLPINLINKLVKLS